MVLFADAEPRRTRSAPRRSGRKSALSWAILGTVLLVVILMMAVPTPYVIEQPGPVYDTLGEVRIGDEEVTLIEIPSQTTYPTSGALSLLTVTISGNRQSPPNWFEVAAAALDASKTVVPIDEVYPVGITPQESSERGRIDMENSKQEAVAAALGWLGYEVPSTLTVLETQEGMPADGVLLSGDVLLRVNGESFSDVTALREAIAANGVGTAATFELVRDGMARTVELTPVLGEDPDAPVIGIYVGGQYEFPFEVEIQLENVGGPSAGMMFALGIIDKLTPGELNGGHNVAGTGTISGAGEVGPIGGIQQKLWGAANSGAEWFLAPQANCAETVGKVPAGLSVLAVRNLDDALAALEAIAAGEGTAALPTCSAPGGS